MAIMYIYNDYTNINLQIIDEYNLDLKIFYNEIPNNIIKEIPVDKINIIVNKAGEIIENSKITKNMTFNDELSFLSERDKFQAELLYKSGLMKKTVDAGKDNTTAVSGIVRR